MADDRTEAVDRSRLYALLAIGFDRPGEELEELLTRGAFATDLREAAATVDLEKEVEAVIEALPESTDDIRDAYSGAFGFEGGGEVPIYETEYNTKTLLTSTHDLADIGGFYRAFGLELADGARERVDHLCIQLEFCSDLALRTATLSAAGDQEGVEVVRDAHRSFVEDHLGRWVPLFVESVYEEIQTPVYRELADLLEAFLEVEAARLDADPEVFPEEGPEPHADPFGGEDDFRCGTCSMAPQADPPGSG